MRLVDVYEHPEAEDVLWHLLQERQPDESISHKRMPSVAQHKAFVATHPYMHWYLIDCGDLVGATYLSYKREIGIGILLQYRRHGYATNAVKMLMEKHPGPFLANVNHRNEKSIRLFRSLGFNQIQVTYAHD